MTRDYTLAERRLPHLPADAEPISGSPLAELFDMLDVGFFPGTVAVLKDGSIIADVAHRYRELVADELGDLCVGKAGFCHIEPLPRARMFASAAWDFVISNGLDRWKPHGSLIVPRSRTIISKGELLDAFPDADQLTPDEIKNRIVKLWPQTKGPSVQCNFVRLRAALKAEHKKEARAGDHSGSG